ncbi:type VI secretion system protein TssA [Pseudomonas guariconensis]|uniref:type VI secretion system protein TssA n=1 Tax=Pseudomonas guariconensis TaxID=1288410 RepID=UPI002B05C6A0|nr:type VI secretion system protein TssA [Pseudomonas guariconensis]
MSEERSARIQALMAPIETEAPAGHDIEYDTLYEQIRQAREHEDVVAEDEWACEVKVADWQRVISLGEAVLREHSKHFQIACWLSQAWMQKQGLTGLAQGLELLEGMVRQWWADGFPALEADGEPYRLAMFGRLDRDIGQWLLTHAMTGAPQCSLAWWQQVLRHEHAKRSDEGSPTDEYSLEQFRLWVVQALDSAQLRTFLEQVRHCRSLLQPFAHALSAVTGNSGTGVMAKTLEGLDDWEAFLSRMLEWLSPPGDSDEEVLLPSPDRVGERPAQSAQSREAAIRQMQDIARYFRQHEPSSPVPMLMDRAVRWASMPLQQWLAEMVRDENCLREINLVLEGPQA